SGGRGAQGADATAAGRPTPPCPAAPALIVPAGTSRLAGGAAPATPTAQRGRAADEACPGILVRRRERPLEQLGGRNVADHGPTDTARQERTTARARTAAIGNRG